MTKYFIISPTVVVMIAENKSVQIFRMTRRQMRVFLNSKGNEL